ncbi:hypothetical protein HPB51_006155 [Rhipicephalus microplus]|uniref:Uncharacterized protein n=1 Tax=Rhipicephalus microplus TaxID=6941 RepID=A0A9J6ER83_RHIMP|nr:hypothetical protein HPB51_006155 [Rhipicephalus microplus]
MINAWPIPRVAASHVGGMIIVMISARTRRWAAHVARGREPARAFVASDRPGISGIRREDSGLFVGTTASVSCSAGQFLCRESSFEETMQRLHGREAMLRMRSLPLATTEALGSVFVHQTVYVFPPPGQPFDPNCVRLVTRGRDPATAVACMLGFFKLVCEDGYKQMVRASEVDGVWLNDVHVSGVFVRRELRSLCADSVPAATMDDFYVLLSVLLCNLPRVRGSNLNRDWFENRVNDLVELFPGVSEPPPVPLYGEEQADAISEFGEMWRHTKAALCRALLRSRFEGPMRQVQEYVSAGWRFAGMKHVQLILEFLHGRNSWVLDIIPELRAKGDQLQAFLKAYQRLGADGPYMKLLHLPEAATASRKRLGVHVAAAYAFAVLEDDNWLQYRGVPRDEAEEAVLAKIMAIKRMGLGATPRNGLSAVAPRDGDDDTRGVDVAAAGEPAAHASARAP